MTTTQSAVAIIFTLLAVFLVVFGAVTNNAGSLSTGTGLIGSVAGYVFGKNSPAIGRALGRAFGWKE